MPKPLPSPPGFIDPCKPRLQAKPPSGDRWIHEIKFDGYRIGVRVDRGTVKVLSSGGNDLTAKAGPAIAAAAGTLPTRSAYFDGELVVEDKDGLADFGALQAALSAKRTELLRVMLLDLLYLNGEDLRSRPLADRRAKLEALVAGTAGAAGPMRLSASFDVDDGMKMFEHACRLGVEGVVSKLKHSRYVSGESGVWVKTICRRVSSFVVGGYQRSKGSLTLYFGERKGRRLFYRGHVDVADRKPAARDLVEQIERMHVESSPFADRSTSELAKRHVRPVEAKLRIRIEHRGITETGRLRHPSFAGSGS